MVALRRCVTVALGMGVKCKRELQREKEYRRSVWRGGMETVTESGWSAVSSPRTKTASSPRAR